MVTAVLLGGSGECPLIVGFIEIPPQCSAQESARPTCGHRQITRVEGPSIRVNVRGVDVTKSPDSHLWIVLWTVSFTGQTTSASIDMPVEKHLSAQSCGATAVTTFMLFIDVYPHVHPQPVNGAEDGYSGSTLDKLLLWFNLMTDITTSRCEG